MHKLINIILIYSLIKISIQQQLIEQKGLGLNCLPKNRDFWRNVKLSTNHQKDTIKAFNKEIPVFDTNLYLSYNGIREPVDSMMDDRYRFF